MGDRLNIHTSSLILHPSKGDFFVLDTYRVLISAAPEMLEAAIDEIRYGKYGVAVQRLAPEVALVELEQPLAEWHAFLLKRPAIFVRHIAPVHRELVLDGTPDDLERLTQVALNLAPHLPARKPFAVQTRLLDDHVKLTRFEINQALAEAVSQVSGLPLDVRNPQGVLSVALSMDRAYLGVSTVEFNRSAWAGGAHRFAREQGQLSRAEFKLLEAQALFNIEWPDHGQALDLGAAPGGWTRILRRAGLPVVAIDPADLHPSLRYDQGVRHLQILAQRFLPTQERFTVIVNDMRIDARDSAWLMVDAANALTNDGLAVVTLKLPHEHSAQIAYHSLSILRTAYWVIGARQLFHNRSEVTAVLRKKHEKRPKPEQLPRD